MRSDVDLTSSEAKLSRELERIERRLGADGKKALDYFLSLEEEAWHQQVYTTGSKWTVRHILAHFVSAENGFNRVLIDVLNGGPGAPRDLDINEFNEREVPALEHETPETLIRALRAARSETVRLARTMKDSDLDRRGYHPWFGEVVLSSMLKLVYRHNMIHLRDIRKALRTGKPVPHMEIALPTASEG